VNHLVPRRRHRGGAFGTLVLLAAIGAIGYYAYKYYFEAEEAPSCRAQLNRCITACRKTTSEAPEAQACQESCQRDADACDRK
jgi:uncharacterized membrane protein YebE (DUF533 family)